MCVATYVWKFIGGLSEYLMSLAMWLDGVYTDHTVCGVCKTCNFTLCLTYASHVVRWCILYIQGTDPMSGICNACHLVPELSLC